MCAGCCPFGWDVAGGGYRRVSWMKGMFKAWAFLLTDGQRLAEHLSHPQLLPVPRGGAGFPWAGDLGGQLPEPP